MRVHTTSDLVRSKRSSRGVAMIVAIIAVFGFAFLAIAIILLMSIGISVGVHLGFGR
jgi:hypothetical protein